MPDLDGGISMAALSRPSITSTTPILPPKNLTAASAAPKMSKQTHVPPPRIDLEPLYTALKQAITEHWGLYKESISLFIMGQMNQAELSSRIDPFLLTPTGEVAHLHNQLIMAIMANTTREMPDLGVASWVSANDKPTAGVGSKPVTGDAAEQRLKAEVMQLPNRYRKSLKDLAQNAFDPYDAYSNMFEVHRRSRPVKIPDSIEPGAGGLNKTNWDLEIQKRFVHPLACESGEFPDIPTIESRMLPICYENGLTGGHVTDAAYFMCVATETYIKEVLSNFFSATRSNGPGTSGTAGTGGAASWIQTHKYRRQLEIEEEASIRGEIIRDKNGLLPIEARAASERGPLGMADVRTALAISDCGLGQMPVVMAQIKNSFAEGEVAAWNDYSHVSSRGRITELLDVDYDGDTLMGGINGINGHSHPSDDREPEDDWGWEGEHADRSVLDSLLDSCLVGA